MKKAICASIAVILMCGTLAACSNKNAGFDSNRMITVVSREDGSGTRTAFTELFGLEEKTADGQKKDLTTKEAMVSNKTDVMLSQVAGSAHAIGYVSLGSLNDTVKALKIDGAAPTAENIKSGTYKISRPFLIATRKDMQQSALCQEFLTFILSAQGQKVVEDNKYIKWVEGAPAFETASPSGKLVVGGSSSVTPVMEKLKEAYVAINPGATIEIQQTDSSTGLQSALEGSLDIAMASRDLKDAEKEKLTPVTIALDGIAVIVNQENPLEDAKQSDITKIFKGEAEVWSDIIG